MKFGPVPVQQAGGKILAHNIPRRSGRGAFRKGKAITPDAVTAFQKEGIGSVYVVELEADDLDENQAARRVAQAAMGSGLDLKGPSQGHASLVSLVEGVLRVDAPRLERVNACEGVAFATLRSLSRVHPGQAAAAVKIIPYAMPEARIAQAEAAARGSAPLLEVKALLPRPVGLLLCGLPAQESSLRGAFTAPLADRVEACGSHVAQVDFAAITGMEDEPRLAQALCAQVKAGARLVILAGETSIMDRNDLAPRAIRSVGGQVVCVGAPVEPGNLLMLAYLDGVPLLGVPGCARSRQVNAIDLVLPALLAGFALDAADIARLGYGGLLEEHD